MTFKYGEIYDGNEKARIKKLPSGNVSITLGGKHVCNSTKEAIVKTALENYRTIKLSEDTLLVEINDIIYIYVRNELRVANLNDVFKYLEEDLPVLG